MEPTYRLEGIIRSKEELEDFEGPLNLILMLLAKNKIEIRDIRVSEILDQYLVYLAEMESMDLEVASEFVQMASHLLFIKTKMLLSSQDEVSELELLMASLEQLKSRDVYTAVKQVIPAFEDAARRGFLLHTKMPEPRKGVKEYLYSHNGAELLSAILNAVTRSRAGADEEVDEVELRQRILPQKIVYNVKDKGREIMIWLRERRSVRLAELYLESRSRSEVVATFISALELCSMGNIRLSLDGDEIVLNYVAESEERINFDNE